MRIQTVPGPIDMNARTLLLAILATILATGGCATQPPKEPSNQGKSLSAWLEDYARTEYANEPDWTPAWTEEDRQAQARAVNAVREIGTNAIPWLLEMVSSQDAISGHRGVLGFQALGRAAKPAVPALIAMMQDPLLTHRATVCPALGAIGPAAEEAVPVLLKHSNPWAAGPTALCTVPALARIHMHPELVVPIFAELLRTNSSWGPMANPYLEALGSFGSQAQSAVPAILPFVDSKDESVRVCATNALRSIGSDRGRSSGRP
jgi:hypothetical protein